MRLRCRRQRATPTIVDDADEILDPSEAVL